MVSTADEITYDSHILPVTQITVKKPSAKK